MVSTIMTAPGKVRCIAIVYTSFWLKMVWLAGAQTPAGVPANNLVNVSYGVDISFPIHHVKVSTNYPWLPHNVDPAKHPTPPEYQNQPIQVLGDKQGSYDRFIEGCRKKYGSRGGMCDSTERDRVAMSLRQPTSMQVSQTTPLLLNTL